MDLFDKLITEKGALGAYKDFDGYFMFPKLTGPLQPRMQFRNKEVLVWSINNYLGLGSLPEVIAADAQAAAKHGLAYPMGARMMSGNTDEHEALESELASFINKESVMLQNYGYQGIMSTIDALLDRHDVVVYDAECHACIIDALRMHPGKRFVYPHNNIEMCERQLERATKYTENTRGGILVITEGVFGMSGGQGKLKEITDLKEKIEFRLLVDDAHGFGTLGKTGAGTGEEQEVQDKIDIYFSTFAKSFAGIGAFIGSSKKVTDYVRFTSRSQIFAKSLPLAFVEGMRKRLSIIKNDLSYKEKLWEVVNALQNGLKERGFNIGNTNSAVTPVYLSGTVEQAASLSYDLRENYNIFCSVVIYPVVPKDVIIIRLIPTAAHTLDDVNETLEAFSDIHKKLIRGEYNDKRPEVSL